jgi:hypothetical protein
MRRAAEEGCDGVVVLTRGIEKGAPWPAGPLQAAVHAGLETIAVSLGGERDALPPPRLPTRARGASVAARPGYFHVDGASLPVEEIVALTARLIEAMRRAPAIVKRRRVVGLVVVAALFVAAVAVALFTPTWGRAHVLGILAAPILALAIPLASKLAAGRVDAWVRGRWRGGADRVALRLCRGQEEAPSGLLHALGYLHPKTLLLKALRGPEKAVPTAAFVAAAEAQDLARRMATEKPSPAEGETRRPR